MKHSFKIFGTLVLAGLIGCGGGDKATPTNTSEEVTPPTEEVTPNEPPTKSVQPIEEVTPIKPQPETVSVSIVNGIWKQTFDDGSILTLYFNDGTMTGSYVDGITKAYTLYKGVVSMVSDEAIAGTATIYEESTSRAGDGFDVARNTHNTEVYGIVDRNSIILSIGGVQYDVSLYKPFNDTIYSQESLAGYYDDEYHSTYLGVDEDGTIHGYDVFGCEYSGAMIMGSHNMIETYITVSGCGYDDGDYEGLSALGLYQTETDGIYHRGIRFFMEKTTGVDNGGIMITGVFSAHPNNMPN